jgi:hypothetical protein
MSYSFVNETLAVMFSILISWSFGIWVYYEWRIYEVKKKVAMAMVLAIAVPLFGTIYPVFYLTKCYHHHVLRTLSRDTIANAWLGDTPLTGDLSELVLALNKARWYVPGEQGGWSDLVRAGGAPLTIQDKQGHTYKFKVGYYFLGKALIEFPSGGYAMSPDLAKALQDLGAPLP